MTVLGLYTDCEVCVRTADSEDCVRTVYGL